MEKEKSAGISRRGFLKGTAAGVVGIAGAGVLVACGSEKELDSSALTGNGTAVEPRESLMKKVKKTIKADVVVLGSGGCGSAAAARAAQLGLNTVLLEKNAVYGGTTMFTEGLFAVGSHWQKAAGVDYTVGEVFSKAMDYHHWLADGSLNHAFFDASAANLDWMESVGIKFRAVSTMGVALTTWHLYEVEEGQLSGVKYVKQWQDAVEQQGATIMMTTPGRELVLKEGKVAGIIAEQEDGSYLYIEAPVAIMATGGYADSTELINELCDFSADRVEATGIKGRDGDGIQMARGAGSALAKSPGTLVFYGGTMRGMPYGTQLYCAAAFQPFFWVNEKGERFANEELAEQNFTHSGNVQAMQKKVYSILTKAQMDMLANEGCVFGCGEYIPRGSKLTTLWKELDDWTSAGKGSVYTAGTLDELSAKISVDSSTLKATVKRFNNFCSDKKDLDYAKNPEYLYPLEGGPYYAFELVAGIFASAGGLKIDTESRVINEDGLVIPGLYAGGCETGGLYGDTYDVGVCAGSCQGFAVHTGKTAAESAEKYLKA